MSQFSGLHLLLTYQCPFECDHCFVWGSPFQTGVMTIAQVREVLRQGQDLGQVSYVAIEGGEPFLYYATVLEAVREAKARRWWVDVLSNAYWALSEEDALLWLQPLAQQGLDSLTLSEDAYHGSEGEDSPPKVAMEAAKGLGLRTSSISILPALQSVGLP
ncbi:MAG: radical SAM protein, partial [Dehalococcoidia bacterium]